MSRAFEPSDFDVEPRDESHTHGDSLQAGRSAITAAAQVRAKIVSSASENSDLLAILAATEYAPGDLAAHSAHLEHIQKTCSEAEDAHGELLDSVNAALKRHKRYRDSFTRKFYYRLTRMSVAYQTRAKEESAAYYAALKEQGKSEDRVKVFKAQVDEAVHKKADLEAEARWHGEAHAKVDQLYESIFKGPTAGFPDEDQIEEQFYVARECHDKVKLAVLWAIKAGKFLVHASSVLTYGRNAAEYARLEAQSSIFSFSAAYASLGRSNYYISQTSQMLDRAVEALEHLEPSMEHTKTKLESLLQAARLQREDKFSDEQLVARVEQVEERLAEVEDSLQDLARATKKQERAGREIIKQTARTLENARQALQQRREAAFEETVGFGVAAPAYHECCDRAEDFCQVDDPEMPALSVDDAGVSMDGVQLPMYGDLPTRKQIGAEDGQVSPVFADLPTSQQRTSEDGLFSPVSPL